MHLAIVSDSLRSIEYAEELEDYRPRAAILDLECMCRGGDWRVVVGESAYHFPTPEELAEAERAAKVAEIKGQLAALDYQSLRALRAVAAGTASDEDRGRLTELEAEAAALRASMEAV